ncbi:MAG: hypothetical protein ACXWTJ_21495, partial [Bdellovibrionota bacterium]
VQAEEQAIRQRLNDPKQLSQLTNLGKATNASEVTGADNKPDAKLFADINGANYMKKILKEKAAAEAMQAKISAAKDTADTNAAALAPPPSNNPDDKNKNDRPAAAPAAGGGLDLKSIAGLATAGAGLAEMMKKNDAANTDTASATSPTPPSQGAAGDKKGPSSSSFGTDKSTTPSGPQIGQPAPKKDPAVAAGHVPGGEGFREPSDISKGMGSSLGASGFTPASAKSTGAGAGGGGGGGLESSAAPASKHEPAAVANGQDDSQGFGGGGLLGGGGPPAIGGLGGPSMPAADAGAPPANPEDSMKDLLHEMKETAEGGLDPTKGQQAADIVMDDQDLFPRVRACYVRVLKQGRVLDGLGEKITEEVQ